jgi:deoxyadenosine/deoxycytidine kinase
MIIHVNGYPGVGKLTVARILTEELGGKLVDNHSIYNLAFALTDYKSAAYYETLEAVRDIAFERVLELSEDVPVVFTNAHMSDSNWGNSNWDAVTDLARRRGSELLVVVLDCQPTENDRRIASPERAAKRKLTDPSQFTGNWSGRPLIDRDGDHTLHIDTTALAAEETAQRVLAWVRQMRDGG